VALAAHAYYMNSIFTYKFPPTAALLDTAMPIAEKFHMVTPYTSLIALVNATQEEQLAQNSQSYYRYQNNPPAFRRAPSQVSLPGGTGISPVSRMGVSNTIRVNERALGFSIPSYSGPLMAIIGFVFFNIVTVVIVLIIVALRRASRKK
jgi:hypothetical protein